MQARRHAKDQLFHAFAAIARGLSSGRRVEIVEVLAQGGRTVDEIADEIGQSVANTSHHLRTLARAGIVSSQRSGTYVRYELASDRVLELWWTMRRVAAEQIVGIDALTRAYIGSRETVPTITRGELLERLERDDVIVVDVRPEPEFAAGHLPGAISIPPDQLELLDELPGDRDVVAYCRGPYCVYADDAVRRLQAHGRNALRLEDGLPEWRHAGAPLEAAS